MAKVLAAVDLARIRQPMYGEGGALEEEIELVGAKIKQQQVVGEEWKTTMGQAEQMITEHQVDGPQNVTQSLSHWWPTMINILNCVGYSRY